MTFVCILLLCIALCVRGCCASNQTTDLHLDSATACRLRVTPVHGAHKLTITGFDPSIAFHPVRHEASRFDVICIKYNSRISLDSELYWIPDGAAGYSMDNQLSFHLKSSGGYWAEYYLPIGHLNSNWNGVINTIRFDPSAGRTDGAITISAVRILADASTNQIHPIITRHTEFQSPVISGIVPCTSTRYLQNGAVRIETTTEGLLLSTAAGGVFHPLAKIVINFHATAGTSEFDTSAFPYEFVFVRFQDMRDTQLMHLFYRSPYWQTDRTSNGHISVKMTGDNNPCISSKQPHTLIITPVAPMNSCQLGNNPQIIDIRSLTTDGISAILLRLNPISDHPMEVSMKTAVDMQIDTNRNCLRIPSNNAFQVVSIGRPLALTDHKNTERDWSMVNPSELRLKAGITAVHARLKPIGSDTQHDTIIQAVVFSAVVSSDYIDINLPVMVPTLKHRLSGNVKVDGVHDALSREPIPYQIIGANVVMHNVGSRTIRIKCSSLLDYRVMFCAGRPIDDQQHYEEFSNYHYMQWMFLWDQSLNLDGSQKLDPWPNLDNLIKERPLPLFIGLHWGNHAPLDSYTIFHKLYPQLLQIDSNGQPHKGLGGAWPTPPFMCLVHPVLHEQISLRLALMFRWLKKQPFYRKVFGFSSSSEPWIAADEAGCTFCYNEQHIKWFRDYERRKWHGDMKSFNKLFSTSYRRWEDVEPPRDTQNAAYYNEWLVSKVEAVLYNEQFFRLEIYKHDRSLPNYAHTAIMCIYNVAKTSLTPDLMTVGRDINKEAFLPGGDLYTNIPLTQALMADSIRGVRTDQAAFPECYANCYMEAYRYLVGSSGLFKKSFSNMIAGQAWNSGLTNGDAWQVFSEIQRLLCLDFGDVPLPRVAILFDVISANSDAIGTCHSYLFSRNIDRCVITNRMVEEGILDKIHTQTLVISHVSRIPSKALSAILKVMQQGMHVIITEPFAESDYYAHSIGDFQKSRNQILQKAHIVNSLDEVEHLFIDKPMTTSPGVIVYHKTNGILFYNGGVSQTIHITLPDDYKRQAVIYDTGQVVHITRDRELDIYMEGGRAFAIIKCTG